jgi:tRNA A22 N-methylase
MKIKIGADEIILWLRKNNLVLGISNDGFGGLGRIIYDIIIGLGGNKILDNQESFWDIGNDSKNISEILLPKTSAQYEIETDVLPKLYEKLIEINQKNST